MRFLKRFFRQIQEAFKDENFLHHLEQFEAFVSKFLSIAMVLVILVSIYDFCIFLVRDFLIPELSSSEITKFNASLFAVFGLFLNILIALEILENITAYLKKHVIQVELVIVTSLIAVARKIIILDLEKKTAMDLIALAIAIFALSGSYWMIRNVNRK
jgi:uncharacterized membrane protein (DUF373 family)